MPSTSKPKFNTLTTAGRLAKAAHDHAQAAPPTPVSPPPAPPPAKPKKKKIAVLPPPAELEAEAALRAEAKASAKQKKTKKPLTTQDKIAASAASRKKKQGAGGEKEKAKGGSGTTKGKKPRNVMTIMRDFGQMDSAWPTPVSGNVAGKVQTVTGTGPGGNGKGKTKPRDSVLVRPTERTKRMQQAQLHKIQAETDANSPHVPIKREDDTESPPHGQTGLMDLAPHLRQRIWRLAVVETQFFIYPAADHEQPDLAMTSRQVRSEVLPLYYGENTFAIEIPVSTSVEMGKKKAKGAGTESLATVKKWMTALADQEHFPTITKWAFLRAPPIAHIPNGTAKAAGNKELVVSIRFPKPAPTGGLCVKPQVEIHRQAFCLLKSHKLFCPCVCGRYPRWLDDAVSAAVLAEGQDRGKQIVLVAKDVANRGGELLASRCGNEIVELE